MKKLTLTSLALLTLGGMWAAPITPEEALARYEAANPSTRSASKSLKLKHTFQDKGLTTAYVFTPAEGEGFTILSADDIAVPVLGYSDNEMFDALNMPPALAWWLSQLSSSVNNASENGLKIPAMYAYAPADMTPISPLCKTKWNQDAPFNNDTPLINGRPTYTGCVATSFAQAMKYFNYPDKGEGSITYYDGGTRRAMSLTRQISWDLMLDQYVPGNYTSDEADAVAYLMKACGFSVEMSYGVNASGAVSYKLASAAVNYFKYDPGVYYTERDYYTLDEWSRLIYNNLKNVGPVIYDGMEMAGGHSFICDGYDGNGYFHFNWGWGGLSDGYYVLDALNPESQGIGASDGGFNKGQSALIGLQPLKEGSEPSLPNIRIMGTVAAALKDDNINFRVVNGGTYTGLGNAFFQDSKFYLGGVISKIDNPSEKLDVDGYYLYSEGVRSDMLTLGPSSYIPGVSGNIVVPIPALEDGEYKVSVACRDASRTGAPLQPMICDNGCVNYCYLSVAGGNYKVTTATVSRLEFVDVGIDTPLYMDRNCRLVMEVNNTSDIQLTQGYYPALYRNGRIQYVGDYMLISVDPGETVTSKSFTQFKAIEGATSTGYGEYQLVLISSDDNNTVIGYYGIYNMTSASSRLTVVLDDFAIEGANLEDVTSGSRTFKNVFVTTEADEMLINLDYTVVQGYFDTTLRIVGSMYDPATNKFETFDNDVYSEHPFAGEGEEVQVSVPLNLNGLKEGMVYRLVAGYMENNTNRTLGSLYFQFNSSGISSIIDDGESSSVYYDLQGRKIKNPQPGQILIERKGTVTKKVIY